MPPSRNRTRSQRQITTPQPRSGGYSGYRGSPGIAGVQPIRDLGAEALTRSLGLIGQITDKWENEEIKKEIDQARTDAYSSQIDNLTPPEYRYKASTEAWMGQKGDLFASHVGDELANKIANEFYPDVINQGQVNYESLIPNHPSTNEPFPHERSGDVINNLNGEQFKTEAESIQAKAEEFLNTFIKDNNITDQNFLAGFYPRVNQKMKSAMDGVKKAQAERYMLERQKTIVKTVSNVLYQHMNEHLDDETPVNWLDLSSIATDMAKKNGITRDVAEKIMIDEAVLLATTYGRPDLLGEPPSFNEKGTGLFENDTNKSGFSYADSVLFSKTILDGYKNAIAKQISLEKAELKKLQDQKKAKQNSLFINILKEVSKDKTLSEAEILNKTFELAMNDEVMDDKKLSSMLTLVKSFDTYQTKPNIDELRTKLQSNFSNYQLYGLNSIEITDAWKQLNILDPNTASTVSNNYRTSIKHNQQTANFEYSQNKRRLEKEEVLIERDIEDKIYKGKIAGEDFEYLLSNITNGNIRNNLRSQKKAYDEERNKNADDFIDKYQKRLDNEYIKKIEKLLKDNKSTIISFDNLPSTRDISGKTGLSMLEKITKHNGQIKTQIDSKIKKDIDAREKLEDSYVSQLISNFKPTEMSGNFETYAYAKSELKKLLPKDEQKNINEYGNVIERVADTYKKILSSPMSLQQQYNSLESNKLGKTEKELFRKGIELVHEGKFEEAKSMANKLKEGAHFDYINKAIFREEKHIRDEQIFNQKLKEKNIVKSMMKKLYKDHTKVSEEDISNLDIDYGLSSFLLHLKQEVKNIKAKDLKKETTLREKMIEANTYLEIIGDRSINAEETIKRVEEDNQIRFDKETLKFLYDEDRKYSKFAPNNPEENVFVKNLFGIFKKDDAVTQESLLGLYKKQDLTVDQWKMLAQRLDSQETARNKNTNPYNAYKTVLQEISNKVPDPYSDNIMDAYHRNATIKRLQTKWQNEITNYFIDHPSLDMWSNEALDVLKTKKNEFFKENFDGSMNLSNELEVWVQKAEKLSTLVDSLSKPNVADIFDKLGFFNSLRLFDMNSLHKIDDEFITKIKNNNTQALNFLKENYPIFEKYLSKKYTTIDKTPQSTTTNLPEGLPSEAKDGDQIIIDGVTYIYSINNGWFKQEGY